jgi:transposase
MVMDPDWLRSRLESGRSIESIAKEAGKHPSTVGYWANKHGLTSAHATRHAARGPIDREVLAELLAEGLTVRAMAERLGRSYTTVRHWLARHELATPRAARLAETAAARATGAETVEATCPVHGVTLFVRRGADGFRCRLCRSGAVDRRRKEVKRILVSEAGGRCALCGYDRSMAGLHFHHLEPSQKAFALSARGMALSLASARAEAAKCVLLCSNCHAEVEAGLASPP